MKKVMTLLLILVLSGCTRLSIGNETVETKKEARDFYLENFTLKKMIYSY